MTYDAGVAGQRLLRIAQPVAVVHVHHIVSGEQARQVARTEGAGLPRVGIRAPVACTAAAVEQGEVGYDLDHDRTERLRQTVSEHAVGTFGTAVMSEYSARSSSRPMAVVLT